MTLTMGFVDHYAILRVPSTASDEQIREAYRLAARRFHPDANKAPGAAVVFKDINTAYKVLSDPAKRADYDANWQKRATDTPGLVVEPVFSRRKVRKLEEPQLLYVLLNIQPTLKTTTAPDAPLNLSLVVDRSTSMQGPRLQNLKAALHNIIGECDEKYILSVVTFSDNAEVLIPAQHPTDPREMKARISTIRADGATAIFSGLKAGLAQVERNRHSRYVNHIILITDGRTYGDEDDCLRLAGRAREAGIGISAMGIGEDWNDRFLDALAAQTGGASAYISSPEAVTTFLQQRVRSLATAYAERVQITVAPAANVKLVSTARVSPNPMMLDADIQPIPLGSVDGLAATRLMLQFHLMTGAAEPGEFFVGRVDVSGEVLGSKYRSERLVLDLTVEVQNELPEQEEPPQTLLDALTRLTMYRLQSRAREALESGDITDATRKLESLATRLFENGAEELGKSALHEARRVAHTRRLSDEGAKQLKYGTRALWPFLGDSNG